VLDPVAPLADRFAGAGHRLYLVGGIVRDVLADRPLVERNDVDLTTDATPEQIKSVVAPVAEALWTQGERFGTIGCRIGGVEYEITTHRAEVYRPESRKPEVRFSTEIDADLSRGHLVGAEPDRSLRRCRGPGRKGPAHPDRSRRVVLRRPAAHDARRAVHLVVRADPDR
jgi:hypothetical protein